MATLAYVNLVSEVRTAPVFCYIHVLCMYLYDILSSGQKTNSELLFFLSGVNCEKNIDECASGPCLNQGICTDGINSYTCHCSLPFTGWSGQTCSVARMDFLVLATAVTIATFCNKYFAFLSSTTGKHCEMEQVPCASHPCEKGGVCRPSADYTSYTCRCPAGWQGASALQFVMRQIVPQTPKVQIFGFHLLIIHSSVSSFMPSVLLVAMWVLLNGTGPRCNEDVNECKKNPCKNGGRCLNSQGSYVCKCQPGYSGHNCQIDIDDCTPSECFFFFSLQPT